MSTKLDDQSMILMRLWAWMQERFGIDKWFFFLILYVTGLLFGRISSGPQAWYPGHEDFLGYVAAWSFFLMLRLFDEHKDYQLDCRLHPERVLQRGLVTLGHLKVLLVFAIIAQLGISLWLDKGFGRISQLWVLVFVWSLLMAVEFFCGAWLKRRVALYAFSHMLVMPMFMLWIIQMGYGQGWPPLEVAWLALLSFLSGLVFEITRKTWGPEEEKDGQDSYSQLLGIRNAPLVILALLFVATAVVEVLLFKILVDPAWFWHLFLFVGLLLSLVSLLKFRAAPSAKGRKGNEAAVGVSVMIGHVVLISVIIRAWQAYGC
jgi:4-hydroxybenzoate polyprenyltransferase